MRCGTRLVVVVLTQRLIDLVESLGAFQLGWSFPEQSKTLATNTAIKISAFIRALAQNLHCYLLTAKALLAADHDNSCGGPRWYIPKFGVGGDQSGVWIDTTLVLEKSIYLTLISGVNGENEVESE